MSASAAATLRTSRAPESRSGQVRTTTRAAGRAEPQRPSKTWSVLFGASAVALAAGLRVWTGLLFADLGYEHVRAVDLGERLEIERQALEDELASLRSTDFLEAEAGRRLGLGPPSAGQVVDLRSEPREPGAADVRAAQAASGAQP